jgi:hypothetical protein
VFLFPRGHFITKPGRHCPCPLHIASVKKGIAQRKARVEKAKAKSKGKEEKDAPVEVPVAAKGKGKGKAKVKEDQKKSHAPVSHRRIWIVMLGLTWLTLPSLVLLRLRSPSKEKESKQHDFLRTGKRGVSS